MARMRSRQPSKFEITLEIVLGTIIVVAVAIFAHRYPWYSALPPPNVDRRDLGGPPITLTPMNAVAELRLSSSMSTLPDVFGVPVRILTYRGDFLATNAVEGMDGGFYSTYYWDKGSTPYDPDRFAALTGGSMRELFAGESFDGIAIVSQSDGEMIIDVGDGTVVHGSGARGLWGSSAAGVRRVAEPTRGLGQLAEHGCAWCRFPSFAGTGTSPLFCSAFARGEVCDASPGVTFRRNGPGAGVLIDRNAYLVGSGPDRFLLIEPRLGKSPIYIEGFASPFR
jgi:hypothetical protein